MSNAKLLEKAFNQAVNQVDISRVHPELNRVIIKTGMQVYADSKGVSFTSAEVDHTISHGLATLSKAGDDYRHQDWMMLR